MRQLGTWLKNRLETFALLPDYGKATAQQWMNILFGETVLGVIFLVWWALANPKNPPLLVIFVSAIFVAGYFVWRADHVRLIPSLELVSIHSKLVPSNAPTHDRLFIQVLVRCKNEASLHECRAQLLRIFVWANDKWVLHMDEIFDLTWENSDEMSMTLDHGADRKLNVCFLTSSPRHIFPSTKHTLSRVQGLNAHQSAVYRFDIQVKALICKPEKISVKLSMSNQWDTPKLERIDNDI